MPSISTSVDVDFDWGDVIHTYSDAQSIAAAIHGAGLAEKVVKALGIVVTESVSDHEWLDPIKELDRLIDEYARGLPIDDQLRRIAYAYCRRIITASNRMPS